jgi:hypothetical protein
MRRLNSIFSSFFLALILLSQAHAAPSASDLRRAAIVTTAAEVALATTSFLKDRNPNKSVKTEWSIRVSDRNWVLSINGSVGDQNYGYTVAGFLWGGESEDWLVTYSGLGNSTEPIFLSGKALWRYDANIGDHATMSFEQAVKFGENSYWGWMRGSEIIIGGALGGAGGVIVAVRTPAAVLTGLVGAMGGAASAVALSDVAKEFLEAHDPPAPPPAPKPPNIPKK